MEAVHFRLGETTGTGLALADVLDLTGPLAGSRDRERPSAPRPRPSPWRCATRPETAHAAAARLGITPDDLARRVEDTTTEKVRRQPIEPGPKPPASVSVPSRTPERSMPDGHGERR